MMSKASKVSVAAAMAAAVLAGACSPAARPYGIGAGSVLAGAGTGLLVNAAQFDCPEPEAGLGSVFCGVGAVTEGFFGIVTGVTGLAILAVALASSSGPQAAPPAPPAWEPDAAPASASASGSAPGVWPALPTSRSPSAPLGSPLAPTSALSLRTGAGSGTGSLMTFH
jgi:hypothetical protein